jgi:phosphoribosyl 1,2-cyclic phosphate phosphodiesterase
MSGLRITFLGTGTSQGVPVIACGCGVCQSTDEKDKRLRSSVKIEHAERVLVIDTGPDFRQQMLRSGTKRLDAVLYTHEHKDHLAGMDDVRPFNFIAQQHVHLYATERVEEALKREFYYAFGENKYPGAPEITVHRIENHTFHAGGLDILPIEAMHGSLPVMGFRMREFVYLTDANFIGADELDKMRGCKILVINALRLEKHYSHFNLEEALDIIREVKPEKAFLTHISHRFGKHDDISRLLPENVYAAYDGLILETA